MSRREKAKAKAEAAEAKALALAVAKAKLKVAAEQFGERRAREEAAEIAKNKAKTLALFQRDAQRKRREKAAGRLQAFARAVLVRANHVPRLHRHLTTWRAWSLRRAFSYYVDRQNALESRKERVFLVQHRIFKRTQAKLEASSASQLGKLFDSAGLSRDNLGPILDFDPSSLKRAAAYYMDQHVAVRAERTCREHGFSFREVVHAFQSGAADVFHYFSEALSFPYFVLLLRDFQLLQNSVSNIGIQQNYAENGVRADVVTGRDYIRAKYGFREFLETRRDIAHDVALARRDAQDKLQDAKAKAQAMRDVEEAAEIEVAELDDWKNEDKQTKEKKKNLSEETKKTTAAEQEGKEDDLTSEKRRIDKAFSNLRRARRASAEAKREMLECESEYKRLMQGASEEEPADKPSPEAIMRMMQKDFGCTMDLTMEAVGLVEEASRRGRGGVTEEDFSRWCLAHGVFAGVKEAIASVRRDRDELSDENAIALMDSGSGGGSGGGDGDHDVTRQQIDLLLEQHVGLTLRYAGFENAIMSVSLLDHQYSSRCARGRPDAAAIAAAATEVGPVKRHDVRGWTRMYGSWFEKGGLFRVTRYARTIAQAQAERKAKEKAEQDAALRKVETIKNKNKQGGRKPPGNSNRPRAKNPGGKQQAAAAVPASVAAAPAAAAAATQRPADDDSSDDSTDEDESPEEAKARHHLENDMLRKKLAPVLRAIEDTDVCSASSSLGKCMLQPSRFLGWLLRYEKNLRQVFMMYSQPQLHLEGAAGAGMAAVAAAAATKSRNSWHDAIKGDNHMSYVDFLRFCRDFDLFPQHLSNDKETDGGYLLLDLFMSSQQDNRSDSKHACDFSILVQPGTEIMDGIVRARFCSICGSREFTLSAETQKKLALCTDRLLRCTTTKEFWSTPLDRLMETDVMLLLGDDPTAAEVYHVTRHVRTQFEELRVISLESMEREKQEQARIAYEERKQRKLDKERKEADAKAAAEAAEEAEDEGKSLSFRRMKALKRRNKANRERQAQLLAEAEKKRKKKEEQKKAAEAEKAAESGGKKTAVEGMGGEERRATTFLAKVSEEDKLKFATELRDRRENFRRAVKEGVQRGRELKARIRKKKVNFPEFLHLLMLCANAAFGKPNAKTWGAPMKALFKVLDPGFARAFGRSLHVELAEAGSVDRDLASYEDRFHWQLDKIYQHWTRGGECDMTGLLFVKMARLTGLACVSDAAVFAAYEASPTMDQPDFVVAVEALLWRSFVEEGHNPSSWLAPVSRASAMTHRGLAIRRACERVACFGLYAPGQALVPAWKILGGRAGNDDLGPVEKELPISRLYRAAASSVMDKDHEATMQACEQLSANVAERKNKTRVSKWKKLKAAQHVSAAMAGPSLAQRAIASAGGAVAKKTKSGTFLTSTGEDGDGLSSSSRNREETEAFQAPKPPSSPMRSRTGRRDASPLVRKRRARKKKKGKISSASASSAALISTHDAYFKLSALSEHLHPELQRSLTPKKRRGTRSKKSNNSKLTPRGAQTL